MNEPHVWREPSKMNKFIKWFRGTPVPKYLAGKNESTNSREPSEPNEPHVVREPHNMSKTIYPNFREVEGELFLVLNEPNGTEILHEKLNAGEGWRLVMQLMEYLKISR